MQSADTSRNIYCMYLSQSEMKTRGLYEEVLMNVDETYFWKIEKFDKIEEKLQLQIIFLFKASNGILNKGFTIWIIIHFNAFWGFWKKLSSQIYGA